MLLPQCSEYQVNTGCYFSKVWFLRRNEQNGKGTVFTKWKKHIPFEVTCGVKQKREEMVSTVV